MHWEQWPCASAYWGVHTARAVANFPLSGRAVEAAACAGTGLGQAGLLPRQPRNLAICRKPAQAIAEPAVSCRAVWLNLLWWMPCKAGPEHSTNMNVNRVIANRANNYWAVSWASMPALIPCGM